MVKIAQWHSRFGPATKSATLELTSGEWPSDDELVKIVDYAGNFGSYVGEEEIVQDKRLKYVCVYID